MMRPHTRAKTAHQGTSVCRWHANYEPAGSKAKTETCCPCQKSQVSLLRYLTFFVSARNILATKWGLVPRGAYHGACNPMGCGHRSKYCSFFAGVLSDPICFNPFQHPKHTRFHLFSGIQDVFSFSFFDVQNCRAASCPSF